MSGLPFVTSRFFARHLRPSSCFRRSLSIHATHASGRRVDPLRILFCGSDAFSIASLNCLVDLWNREKSVVESIDVLCRTDKWVGPGNKNLYEAPIKKAAKEIGLFIHQTDDFREYDTSKLEGNINLIVAVSFGLLIPARLIDSAKYGGLNVHPSFLPDLRGAAPIHHALLHQRKHTGVSVQTLHATKFDHGHILAHTPLPGIPIPRNAIPKDLTPPLAKEGARLLQHVIEEQLFLPPLEPVLHSKQEIDQITQGKGLAKAPKIRKADMRIDWSGMTAREIVLRLRVFGRMWDDTTYQQLVPKEIVRVVYDSLANASGEYDAANIDVGTPFILPLPGGDVQVLVPTKDGGLIEVKSCTIAGKSKKNGAGLREFKRLLFAKILA